MSNHQCSKCNKRFKTECGYERHINRNNCIEKKYTCQYCRNGFKHNSSLNRHINHNCKVRKKELEFPELYEMKKQLEEKDQELKQKELELQKERENMELLRDRMNAIEERMNKQDNQGNQQNLQQNQIGNNNQINNIHLHIVPYGKQKITDKEVNKIVMKNRYPGYQNKLLLDIIEFTHFMKEKNKNIYIPNIRGNFGLVLKDETWNIKAMDRLLEELFVSSKERIKIFIEYNEDLLKKELGYAQYLKFKADLERYMTNKENEPECMKAIKEVLIKNRNLVNKLYKELTGQCIKTP